MVDKVDKRGVENRGKVIEVAKGAIDKLPAPSPNPMTNLIIADVALRAGAALLRHSVERGVLGTTLGPKKAGRVVKGRTMMQSLVGTAIARIATRSVPGAIIVGGGMLAKTLYDRRHRAIARAEGAVAVEEQIERGKKD